MNFKKYVIVSALFFFSGSALADYFVFKDQVGGQVQYLLQWNQIAGARPVPEKNYNRKNDFGTWVAQKKMDLCLNTRGVVLKKFSAVDVEMGTHSCTVISGSWDDPYSGRNFQSSKDIQIDHVVPLKNAYVSGAWTWTKKMKCLYANYLGNDHHLLPVSGHENQSKGDRSPDQYVPPNKSYVCEYLKNWLRIKFSWALNMTTEEGRAIKSEILENQCDSNDFIITQEELTEDFNFKEENKDLCSN